MEEPKEEMNPNNLDEKEENPGEDDKLTNKITVKEFIKEKRISSYVAEIFTQNLDKDEYTTTELNNKYKKFMNEKVEED